VTKVGVVVIGRNEGDRLRRCLESVHGIATKLVYVDSGSMDGSVDLARSLGADIIDLDMNLPFTAARARNAGFQRLIETEAAIDCVQFVDGDCELHKDWLSKASAFMDANTSVAMVCGRLRERFPERSVYNRLCDIEWDTPVGETKACGGIAMARFKAFQAAEGFNDSMIAGEEPELCVRLRQSGWSVWRLKHDMAWHDAAMTRFGQWWQRMTRGGYAFAEGAYLHGEPPERHWVAESRRAWGWGLGIPLVVLVAFVFIGSWGLVLLAVYPAQVIRLALRGNRTPRENWWHAFFLVLGKFPEMIGQIKFLLKRLYSKKTQIIEYK